MDFLLLRLSSVFGVWLGLVLSTLIPFLLVCGRKSSKDAGSRSRRSRKVFSCLGLCNCFAAGVFLSACFLGLVPHVREHVQYLRNQYNFEDMTMNGTLLSSFEYGRSWVSNIIHLPFGEILLLFGFILTLFLEQCTHWCSVTSKNNGGTEEDSFEPLLVDEFDADTKPTKTTATSNHHHGGGHAHSHLPFSPDANPDGISFQSLALFVGMSVHTLFEGIALGVQETPERFLKLLGGILSHEFLCAFAFGISLVQTASLCRNAFWTAALYSFCLPAGMALGLLLGLATLEIQIWFRVVLEGISTGVFVYVVCMEMLVPEIVMVSPQVAKRNGLKKAFCVFLGVSLFLMVQILI